MSAALSGFIALASRGGDGYTHATREVRSERGTRLYTGWCGLVENDATVIAIGTFAASGKAPLHLACVTAIEAAHRRASAPVDCAVEGL